mgnify:CR=1 FL=1
MTNDEIGWGIQLDEESIHRIFYDPVFFAKKICNEHTYWYQDEILMNDSPEQAMRLSRQLGKTQVMAVKVLHLSLTKPLAQDPYDEYITMLIAPTQRQSQIMFNRTLSIIERNNILNDSVEKKIQTEIRFTNNSIIYNFPVGETADRVRGFPIHHLVADEAAYIPEQVFVSLEPSLASTDGTITLISTPFGRFGYFYNAVSNGLKYEDYMKRKTRGLKGVSVYNDDTGELITQGLYDFDGQFVTHWYPYPAGFEAVKYDKHGNPTGKTQLSPRIINRQKRTMHPVKFAQEYEALFVDDTSMYFPYKTILNATEDYPMMMGPRSGHSYIMGVDFAKLQDYYIALVIEETNPLRVVHWQEDKKRDYTYTIAQTATIAKRFGVRLIYADATGVGEPNVEKLSTLMKGYARVEGVKITSQIKNEMYANVYELLSSGKLIIPKVNKEFIDQMQLVTFTKTPSGQLKIEAAPGSHDDYPDALALACMSVMEPRHEIFVSSVPSITPTVEQKVIKTLGIRFVSPNDPRIIRDPVTQKILGLNPWETETDNALEDLLQ